tara:strand:- start:189 stop:1319 length:1131 start_codon:yes stop_codon:yes gene_type:complete
MAGQQQQGQNDSSMGPLWIVIAIFVFGGLLWYLERDIIIKIIFQIKLAEIAVLSLFTSSLDSTKQLIETSVPANVGFEEVANISNAIGRKLIIPIVILFGGLSYLLYRNNAGNRYRKAHSMKSLVEQEKSNWPYVVPVLGLDLVNTSIDEGPWAMTLPPMRFAKKYKLLKEERMKVGNTGLRSDYRIIAKVQYGRANRLFAKQLGNPWPGVWKLLPYQRALFAIFAAKAEGDRAPATKLLRQIAASANQQPLSVEKLNFKGADGLLKKHENSKIVNKIIKNHAYFYTVMASMLDLARMDGVMASAEFIWLKPINRPLWYVLNTVGRQTAPPEVSGIIAHWLAELEIGRPMTIPMIEEATIALESALNELIYQPDED